MRVVVAGGTGFLGRALCAALAAEGHKVTVLTRGAAAAGHRAQQWSPDGTVGNWGRALDEADAVVNLAGESIAARRWTRAQKERIRQSRLGATRSLVAAIGAARRAPAVLLSASAIGYYGDRQDETLTETSPAGAGFLPDVCVEWEGEARRAEAHGTRVATIRTGIVLERDGGALAQMLLPFRLFAGGPIGSGRQFMSWIHRDDWVALACWILRTDGAAGPINGAAPTPVRNSEFARALGRALRRPSWLPAPAFALRLALGEMASDLLLSSQRIVPRRALDLGFQFRHPDLEPALQSICRA